MTSAIDVAGGPHPPVVAVLGGESPLGGPPLAGPEGRRLRALFEFATAPPSAEERERRSSESYLTIYLPAELRKRLKVACVLGSLSMTDVMGRYMAAHVRLSRATRDQALPALGPPGPAEKALRLGEAPLEGRAGARLRELFAYAVGPKRPGERNRHEQKPLGFEVPRALHEQFREAVREQDPPMTGVLARYAAAHVFMSTRAST